MPKLPFDRSPESDAFGVEWLQCCVPWATRNSARISVGASFAMVKALRPKVEVRPHKCDEDGHCLILDAVGGRAALVLEERKGTVTTVRAGLRPAVEFVEGCR